MSREIKFRIWNKEDNRFHKTVYPKYMGGMSIETDFNKSKESLVFQQYTGKKDINGNEIYEGDLVSLHYAGNNKAPNEAAGLYEVSYEGTSFKLKEIKHNWFTTHFTNPKINDNLPDDQPKFVIINIAPLENFGICRVEGNIFENPELLKL
jgi:uncharacterized phage protein (TIGR01671 family)